MNLLTSYTDALALQSQLQREEFEQNQSLPLAERVMRGHSMINLTVDFEFYDGAPDAYCDELTGDMAYIKAAHVHCLSNVSGFREGSSVCLSLGQYRFVLEVVQDSVRHFVLQPNQFHRKECFLSVKDYPRHNWQVDEVENSATFAMLQSVTGYLSEHSDVQQRISALLNGTCEIHYSAPLPELPADAAHLNPSQQEAVQKALATDFIHIIQGPPGTGKTYTIACLCRQLADQGCRVLVSGPTHTAINNCLDKAAQLLHDGSKVVKLGERYQAAEILANPDITRKTRLPQSSYAYDHTLSHDGIIVGATPYALCYPKSKKLEGWQFDYAVVDEASQMSIPMAVAVMSRCSRVIFVGDHQQLSPIIPTGTECEMFSCSIFRFLADHYPQHLTLLNVSYRLNAELLEVPNRLFYGGRLHSEVPVEKPFLDFKGYSNHSQVLVGEAASLLYLHDEFDGIGHSPYEAGVVADIVYDLLNQGVPLSQIGILTPYRAQVREVRNAVYQRGILDEQKVQQLFVDTVDRMQGQERDYVLYTMANAKPDEHPDRYVFFYDCHRLNVAVTRARIKTIVIANEKVFETAQMLLGSPDSDSIDDELRLGLEAFVRYRQISPSLHFDPLDDSDIWM